MSMIGEAVDYWEKINKAVKEGVPPIKPMKEWNPKLVTDAPEQAKPFLQSLNTTGEIWGLEHKPKGMKIEAQGIDPSRWND
jgi:hypothetical protein